VNAGWRLLFKSFKSFFLVTTKIWYIGSILKDKIWQIIASEIFLFCWNCWHTVIKTHSRHNILIDLNFSPPTVYMFNHSFTVYSLIISVPCCTCNILNNYFNRHLHTLGIPSLSYLILVICFIQYQLFMLKGW